MLGHPRGIWNYLRDPTTPHSARLVALLALLYVLSPLDAVPERLVPFVGWLDDVGAATLALRWLASKAAAHEGARAARDAASLPAASPPTSEP